MSYIPHGADQQGRRPTGVWTTEDIGRSAWRSPRRVHPDFEPTYPTGPAPLDGAHAATEVQGDARPSVPELQRRARVRIFSVATALGVLLVTAWVALGGWK